MNDPVDDRIGAIDYDAALTLDAEELAERGVADGYEELSTELSELGIAPSAVGENFDAEAGAYSVQRADLAGCPPSGDPPHLSAS